MRFFAAASVAALLAAASASAAPAHSHEARSVGHHNCLADVITGHSFHELKKRADARIWSYSATTGPAFWGGLDAKYAKCSLGGNQSPIDFGNNGNVYVTEATTPFVFQWPEKLDEPHFENLGYTLEIVPKNVAESGGVLYNSKFYALQQFHFHWASEHRVNGHAYPAEAHFVHKAADGELLVVGLWLEFTHNNNGANNGAGWLDFLNVAVPEKEGDDVDVPAVWITGAQKALESAGGFHMYKGSLTTPPCSEGVNWFVAKEPGVITLDQFEAIHENMIFNSRFTGPGPLKSSK